MEFTSSGDSSYSPNENTCFYQEVEPTFPLLQSGLGCDLLRPREWDGSDIVCPPSWGLKKPCSFCFCILGMLLWGCMGRNPASLRDHVEKGAQPSQPSPLSPASSSPSAECIHTRKPARPTKGLPSLPTELSEKKWLFFKLLGFGLVCYSAKVNWNR